MSSPTTQMLNGLWASSSSDYFAVGGEIWHYDWTSWSKMSSLNDFNWLWGVHGTSSSDVFAVGYWGTIVHYDGVTWSPMKTNTDAHLQSVWASQSDVFVVGYDGTILHYHREVPVLKITKARMVSPSELGIDIEVTFPKDAPEESLRKVDFWASINGVPVSKTFDITRLVQPGDTNKEISFNYGSEWIEDPVPPRIINLADEGVPRFENNVAFALCGKCYWEGGLYSQEWAIPVEIPLPVIIIHGYLYTHKVDGWFLEKVADKLAYEGLGDFLGDYGYTNDSSWYRTLWSMPEITYEADKVTESEMYSIVELWVGAALQATYADRVNLIGHSTGGLVARYYSGTASTVDKVISIGTPHLGLTDFYANAFDKPNKEKADEIMRVPGTNEENLLRWFEPQYGESCLINAETGQPIEPEPYENSFNAAYNNDVHYYSIYANNRETLYKLWVRKRKNGTGWYEIVDPPDGAVNTCPGDGYVPAESTSAFPGGDSSILISGTNGGGTSKPHVFLCQDPEVQKKVLELLRK